MDDVIIAPCRILGQRQRQTSINDQGNLPLGPVVAIARQRLNDDVLDVQSRAVYVADAKERSELQLGDEQMRVLPRALVGKKSAELAPLTADLSSMQQMNLKLNKQAADIETREEIELKFNMVWMPFVTADTFHFET